MGVMSRHASQLLHTQMKHVQYLIYLEVPQQCEQFEAGSDINACFMDTRA